MRIAIRRFALVAFGLAGLAGTLAAAAAPHDTPRMVAITYTDLTGTQPLSTSAFISHRAGFHLWADGAPASTAIARMAEEGNPEWTLALAVFDTSGRFLDGAAALPATPLHGRRVVLRVDRTHPQVSGVWMLGMTNDGFAGVDAVDAYALRAPVTLDVFARDAGTRKDSERRAHTAGLGGLADDPEGGVVTRHRGIRGDADIPARFRFDPSKPVARVTIAPLPG